MLLQTSLHNVINSQRAPLKTSEDFTPCRGADIYYSVNYLVLASKLFFLLSSVK